MTTCCPNCSSVTALGAESASICTECATVTVAGASLSLPLILAGVLVAGVTAVAFKMLRHRAGRLAHAGQPALG